MNRKPCLLIKLCRMGYSDRGSPYIYYVNRRAHSPRGKVIRKEIALKSDFLWSCPTLKNTKTTFSAGIIVRSHDFRSTLVGGNACAPPGYATGCPFNSAPGHATDILLKNQQIDHQKTKTYTFQDFQFSLSLLSYRQKNVFVKTQKTFTFIIEL